MASICRTKTIDDIPNGKGKQVLIKILNSPKADRAKLHQIAVDYEKQQLAEKKNKKGL